MLVPSDSKQLLEFLTIYACSALQRKKISHVLQALALIRKGSLELLYFDFIKMVQCVGRTLPFFLFVFLGQGINGWPGTHYVVQGIFKLRASLLLLPPKYWESHHVHSLFQTFIQLRIIAVPFPHFMKEMLQSPCSEWCSLVQQIDTEKSFCWMSANSSYSYERNFLLKSGSWEWGMSLSS